MFAASKTLNIATAFTAASMVSGGSNIDFSHMGGAAESAINASYTQCARFAGETETAYSQRLWPVFMGMLTAKLRLLMQNSIFARLHQPALNIE